MKLVPWSRTIRCADCGYLCFRVRERIFLGERGWAGGTTIPQYRDITEFAELPSPLRDAELAEARPVSSGIRELHCYRHASPLQQELEDNVPDASGDEQGRTPDDLLLVAFKDVLTICRDCKFWYKYRPGYSPELHLQMEDRSRSEASARFWGVVSALLGAAIGAGATIAGALLLRGG